MLSKEDIEKIRRPIEDSAPLSPEEKAMFEVVLRILDSHEEIRGRWMSEMESHSKLLSKFLQKSNDKHDLEHELTGARLEISRLKEKVKEWRQEAKDQSKSDGLDGYSPRPGEDDY